MPKAVWLPAFLISNHVHYLSLLIFTGKAKTRLILLSPFVAPSSRMRKGKMISL